MPWEGAEEKKQKQDTNNARLAFIFRMATLLTFAKEWKVWHKHWGNMAFTLEIPNEQSSQAEKNRYILMVQTHGSVQLSMGVALRGYNFFSALAAGCRGQGKSRYGYFSKEDIQPDGN
jgi:hypothetical protein